MLFKKNHQWIMSVYRMLSVSVVRMRKCRRDNKTRDVYCHRPNNITQASFCLRANSYCSVAILPTLVYVHIYTSLSIIPCRRIYNVADFFFPFCTIAFKVTITKGRNEWVLFALNGFSLSFGCVKVGGAQGLKTTA